MSNRNIVLNIPHSSNQGIFDSQIGLWPHNPHFVNDCVNKWTDWWSDFLFQTDNEKLKSFVFPYSRFVCDVDMLEDDPQEEKGEGIIYTSFSGYKRGTLTEEDKQRLLNIHKDYLNSIGLALTPESVLIDCHSFPSEWSDADICIGFNQDRNFDETLISIVFDIFKKSGYKVALNKSYSNSLLPPAACEFKSLKIEVNKKIYLNEKLMTLERNQRQWMRWFGCLNRVYDTILHHD